MNAKTSLLSMFSKPGLVQQGQADCYPISRQSLLGHMIGLGIFVPVPMRETGQKGARDGEGKEAYT
jgi:hypothetical protein